MILKVEVFKMKKKNKILNWFKQRRVWAAILSAVAVASVSLGYPIVAQACGTVAGILGLASYIKPKTK